MKVIGFILVVIGFIVAALATVVDQSAIENATSAPAVDANAVEDANSVSTVAQSAVIGDANAVLVADANAAEDAASTGVAQDTVKWLWYIPALALGVAGVTIIRMAEARRSKTEHHVAARIEVVEGSLERIASNIDKLNADKHAIDTYDVRHKIDELFTDDLESFVEARESIAHRYGLAAYAEVMTAFAAGERYLNRVWSASADGYIDEVNTYLEKAKTQFAETLTLIHHLQETNPTAQAT